ncbi:MAG: DNA polymerase domain-containing protein [Cytophagaceae bacterium]
MQVRRNTKHFKQVAKAFEEHNKALDKDGNLKIYITQPGHGINDAIDLDDLPEKEVFYDLTLDAVKQNLANHQLTLQQDESGLYYFTDGRNPAWAQTPFYLNFNFIYPNTTANKSAENGRKNPLSTRSPKNQNIPIGLKNKVRKKSPKLALTGRLADEKLKKTDPNYGLKNPVKFHYLTKTLFKELKVTKKDVLDYYDSMFEFIIPYIKDRPMYFRWHRGGIGSSNYNKSLESLKRDNKAPIPDWIETVTIESVTYKENRHYMLCQDKSHLMWILEIGCVELSPWHSRAQNLENPDYLVIDLDPVEVDFQYVIEVAIKAGELLQGLNMPHYYKTSGSKGIHIYVPLNGKADFEVSRVLAELICNLIHLKIKDITSLERIPSSRKGKVYLDYLQNAHGKSLVAPYSLRPNDFAGVAMPIEAEKLAEPFKIQGFNIFNVMKLAEKQGDIFKNMRNHGIDASEALKYIRELYGFLI